MTAAAKVRRAFRHKYEQGGIALYSATFFGKRARPAQVRSAVRQILMNHTASCRRQGYIAAP